MLAMLAWKHAMDARGAAYRFFEHLRTIVGYVVFESWDHLLRSIAAAAAFRSPWRRHPPRIAIGSRKGGGRLTKKRSARQFGTAGVADSVQPSRIDL
jgi:hypothetical protein